MDTSEDTISYTAHRVSGAAERSRTGHAYDVLKRGLLVGEFPLAQRLAEERLARELEVSRTPVREALSRLHAEGLVDRHPEGGYCPAVPDLDSIVELYEVRGALEQSALSRPNRSSIGHERGALEALREEWRAMGEDSSITPEPEFVLLDEDFHVRLAFAAGNEQLVAMLIGVNQRIRIVRMHDFLTPERIDSTIEQHIGVLDAALAGDLVKASECLGAHLAESAAVVHERAARAIGRMLRGDRRDRR